jgi:site-specific DNA recombinase
VQVALLEQTKMEGGEEMKGGIYARVSTKEQREQGTSLDSQKIACLDKARQLGYEIPEANIFLEDWTGADLDRPQLNKARNLIKQKEIDGLLCYSTDRLARNPIHIAIIAEECERRDIQLVFVTEPLDSSPEGQLICYVKGYAAQIEREKIAERTRRGKKMRAMAGRLPAGSHAHLYGYDYIPGKGVGEGIRYVNENQTYQVRRMFKWLVDESMSTHAITFRLRDLGVPTPSGKGYWNESTVHKILTNPAYCGKTYAFTQTYGEPKYRLKAEVRRKKSGRIWKPKEEWLEIPNATPPIISEDLFEAAQKQLQRNRQLSRRNAKSQYLLNGHICCSRCGRGYWGYLRSERRGDKQYKYRRYHCSGSLKIVSPVRCDNRTYLASYLEDEVWRQVEALLSSPELVLTELRRREQEARENGSLEADLERVAAQIANREKQKGRVWKAFEITGDEERFKREIAVVNSEIKALEEETVQLEKRIVEREQVQANEQSIEAACELIKQNLGSLTFEHKRLALEALQIRTWVDGTSVTIKGVIPIPEDKIVPMPLKWHPPVRRRENLREACHRASLELRTTPG